MWEKLFFYWLHSTPMWSVVVLQCSHLWYSDSQSRCCICSQWTKGQYAFSVCLVVHPVCTAQILLNMNTGLSGISINILMQAPHCQWAEPPEFNWCIVISPSTSTELRIHWPPSSAWFTWWQQTQYLRQKPFPAFIHSIFRIEENSCDYPFICSSMLFFDLFHCWLLSCIALQALFLLCLFSISLPQSLFIVPFALLVKHFVRNLLFKRRYE